MVTAATETTEIATTREPAAVIELVDIDSKRKLCTENENINVSGLKFMLLVVVYNLQPSNATKQNKVIVRT
ncbi:hypothetical protein L1049_024301 [Liquidambar formosana]|uniref:Uncharacterized protein n=1 Tax=Liquidambar formosana TaxID=63359 RepID=A0AAP0X162_LIQFO